MGLSELLRRAMARTRTWTAAAAKVERERTRELARIGSNLNQIACWANAHKGNAEAVEVIAHLVAIIASPLRREEQPNGRIRFWSVPPRRRQLGLDGPPR